MSDFLSNFWSIYIASITIVGIVACALLLWFTSNMKVSNNGGDETSGHVWDEDLREMNNPLPMWWVWLYVLTIVFALGYLYIFPGLGSFGGSKEWTAVNQYEQQVASATDDLKPIYVQFADKTTAELASMPEVKAIGERLYMNNCAQCHASDARGTRGFPNLTDNDWLYGGSPEKIQETITNGRNGMMPPMAAVVGSDADVKNLAQYVLSLSGSPHDAALAALGKEKYVTCAACHGPEGEGNQAMGAPNLADNIWLHGAGEAAIIARIKEGKMNQMPAQATLLTPEQISVLTAYVWSFSNPGLAD